MKWENINGNYSTMNNLMNSSSAILKSIDFIRPINNSALNRENRLSEESYNIGNTIHQVNNKSALNRVLDVSKDIAINEAMPNQKIGNYEFNPHQKVFYDELINNGLSHNQSIAVMMNVQAENSWNPKYLYGDHQDVTKRAYGALSWQGGREKGLFNLLEKEGLLRNGNIIKDPKVMALQAKHFVNELNSTEKRNASNFLKNPELDPIELARMLNKSVIRSSQSANILASRDRAYKSFGRR